MLRTNSLAARANINDYITTVKDRIIDEYEAAPDTIDAPESLAWYIMNEMFYNEKCKHDLAYKAHRISEYDLFKEWAQGLSCCGLFDYYYHPEAREILGDILEETEEERNKYTEEQAEELLTNLIYRELKRNAERLSF